MEYQTKMIYSEETTKGNPLASRYSQLLDAILKDEGAKKTPFVTEKGIDLDQFEKDKNKGRDLDNTMDFCFGLDNGKTLLVEAKLRVKNPINLEQKKLEQKLRHSREILIDKEVVIEKKIVFLFDNQVIGKARNVIGRMFNNSPNVLVYDIQEFKRNLFKRIPEIT